MSDYENLDRMFLAGEWRKGTGDTLTNVSPWDESTIFEMPGATPDDVDQAFKAAAQAQKEWASLPPSARSAKMRAIADIIEARRDEIAGWIVREVGGTKLKAALELMLVTQVVRSEAAALPFMVEGAILPEDIPGKESRAYRRPVGVVALVSPWNFPLQLTARTLFPALALGNGVVIKPSSDSIVTGGTIFAAIAEEAELPPGLVAVLPGSGKAIGDAVVQHPAASVVSFTGSTPVGRKVGQAALESKRLKSLELELGGNSPIVVLDDADIDYTVEASVWGKFVHQGQICMIANRIVVEDSIYDEFAAKFVARTKKLVVGQRDNPACMIGPIINRDQFDSVMELIGKSKATCALGGKPDGLVIPPHVFTDVAEDDPLVTNEIFGPVAPIQRARDEDHALELANATEMGLSSAVFSRDEGRALRFARQIQAGMTHINDQTVNDSPFSPFGGAKNSGIGRFNGRWAVEAFTATHWITVQHEKRQLPFSADDLGN
ncbi:aldehyde dehydrogenase family protein [Erythrobacter arachoides]|uniref:Aldehyde dehydrogenase family protein n=1 Tax=Aurantiacibacter arachoides TaxID=1850444 RepID=A0A845A3Q1_9SPHN|nr:aldehyde dehydrogenase family protein [Aurantiacibacter arachoides]MXO92229.1 aldehyde dehydrogenase family protein [Aurantiacibacter arachoides]GGD58674.1 aldehyde dehydrogenase [Aurantiacibacter arachoides]